MLTLIPSEIKSFFAFRSNLMKQTLIMMAASLIVVLMNLGCGSTNQLAAEIIYDANTQVEAAKEANAQNLAPQELADAEQMLARSEEVLNAGKGEDAYRLGMRAHLKAKIAEAVAIANQMEAEASSSESELLSKLQAAETAHRELEQAEQELEKLQSTPEDAR
jgi:non-homologous end joining protein Ku